MDYIVVTGATGQLGHTIVERLVGLIPAQQVGVSVRDIDKAAGLTVLGVRVRRGDFNDPDSLRHSFEGATQLLMVSSNARASGGDPLAQHHSAIEAAKGCAPPIPPKPAVRTTLPPKSPLKCWRPASAKVS